MRESISSITVFEIMIALTLIFAAFLSVAINYNRAYRIKNETLAIIEKYERPSGKAIGIINDYLLNSGYNTKGKCKKGEFGVASLNSKAITKITETDSNKYFYCLSYYCEKKGGKCKKSSKNIIYGVKVFFNFSLPVFGDIATFGISGDTKAIHIYSLESQKISG